MGTTSGEAGALLAARHRLQRAVHPLLPAEYESAEAARQAVQQLFARRGSGGCAAVDGGQVAGYLIGATAVDPQRLRNAWVHPAGHALAEGQSTEVTRDLYARLAADWTVAWLFRPILYSFRVMPSFSSNHALGWGLTRWLFSAPLLYWVLSAEMPKRCWEPSWRPTA